MKVYLIGAVGLCVLISLSSFLMEGEASERATRVAFSVILLAVLIAPLTEAVRSLPDLFSSATELPVFDDPAYQNVGQDAFETGICRAVAQAFSLSEEEIVVVTDGFDAKTMTAERIHITLTGRAAFADSHGIRDYITRAGIGDCEVSIEIG